MSKSKTPKKLAIGTMQGRLLSKYNGRYQAHPVGYWQEEFYRAQELGLDLIEFILDLNDWQKNPLVHDEGLSEIESVIRETGVAVKTICADYFMLAPIFGVSDSELKQNLSVLENLTKNANRLGVSDIGIACLEKTSLLGNRQFQQELVRNLTALLPLAEKLRVNFSLELDLDPKELHDFISEFNSPRVTVTYDTGNSASFGYDPLEELSVYGNKITDIHIKDRLLNGGSVILGTGNTRFDSFLKALGKLNYSGPIILQAFRDDEGMTIFKEQLRWAKNKFVEYNFQLGINN